MLLINLRQHSSGDAYLGFYLFIWFGFGFGQVFCCCVVLFCFALFCKKTSLTGNWSSSIMLIADQQAPQVLPSFFLSRTGIGSALFFPCPLFPWVMGVKLRSSAQQAHERQISLPPRRRPSPEDGVQGTIRRKHFRKF